jgi:hypothetical protein
MLKRVARELCIRHLAKSLKAITFGGFLSCFRTVRYAGTLAGDYVSNRSVPLLTKARNHCDYHGRPLLQRKCIDS